MTFQCDVEGCGKLFSCKKTLKEHERTHTGERPYRCPICQVTFAQYSSMQKHQRVHDKKKPYKCKYEGCQQAFTQISNLIRHERIHTGEKPYQCLLCQKKFASGSNLKQHMQVHNNEVQRIQFRCFAKPCEKAYLYVSSLKKHIQVSHPVEYEALVKTNKFDLLNCKEFIPDGAPIVHQLSDHEMDEEEGESNGQDRVEFEEEKLSINVQCQVAQVQQENEESLLKKRALITSNKDQWQLLDENQTKTEIPLNFNPLKRQRIINKQDEQYQNDKHQTLFEAESSHYSSLERRDSLGPIQQKVQQITLSLKSAGQNQESPKCNQTVGFIASKETTPRFLENQEKRIILPSIPISRRPYQRIHEGKQGSQMPNIYQLSAIKQETGLRTQQEVPIQMQAQPQLPKITSLGIFDFNNFPSVQFVQASNQNQSPSSDSDIQPVFNFGALSYQSLNKSSQQNVQWNQLPNTTLTLPVPFSQQQTLQTTLNWGSLYGTPKHQLFSHQNSFAQQQPPPNDVFTTFQKLQAELKQEASNVVFDKIQHYAVMAASAVLVQVGLNNSTQGQVSAQIPVISNSPQVQQQQQQFLQMQQQQQQSLIMKQGSFGVQPGTPTQNQRVGQENNSIKEENSNFSFRNNNSILKVDEDSLYFQGVENKQQQSQLQKRVYQHKSVSLKEHKELRVSTHPVTQQPTVTIVSRKNSPHNLSREGSFTRLSSEVMANYQKPPLTTLTLNNNDNSSEMRQSQNYQSLLSPRNNLVSTQPNVRKHSLFKKFKYNPINKNRERKESDPPSSYFGEDGDDTMNGVEENASKSDNEAQKKKYACGENDGNGVKTCLKCQNDAIEKQNSQDIIKPQFQIMDRDRLESLDIKNIMHNSEFQQKIDQQSNLQQESENIESKEQVPLTALNSTQQKILQKNPKQVQIIFSKLPCIKTCMSKMEIPPNTQANPTIVGGGCASGSSNCGKKEKKLSFEQGENDFARYSANQISTASCKSTCDAQKICPELLPTNCDDFFEKRCDCTTYCKKTLKYLQQFVKDANHYAEIEDLCKIVDEPKENNNSSDQMMISPISSSHNEQIHQ